MVSRRDSLIAVANNELVNLVFLVSEFRPPWGRTRWTHIEECECGLPPSAPSLSLLCHLLCALFRLFPATPLPRRAFGRDSETTGGTFAVPPILVRLARPRYPARTSSKPLWVLGGLGSPAQKIWTHPPPLTSQFTLLARLSFVEEKVTGNCLLTLFAELCHLGTLLGEQVYHAQFPQQPPDFFLTFGAHSSCELGLRVPVIPPSGYT